MKRYPWLPWLIGLLVIFLGCGVYVFSEGVPGIAGECVWDARAEAWLDNNQDGIWDLDEQPLPGIPFYIDDTYNDYDNVGGAVSDEQGEAELTVFLPGCPRARFEVYVDVLPDYSMTTPARRKASRKGDELYSFGFVYNLAATPTPQTTTTLACQLSPYQDALGSLAEDWDVASDGTLWAVYDSYDTEVISLNPQTTEYHTYTRETDGLGIVPTGLAVGEDGIVWVTSAHGVARFDGISWISYTSAEGLPDDMVGAVEITADGTVWFATEVGIAQYHPSTAEWTTQSEIGKGIGSTSYSEMTVTSNGSLWLVTNYAAYQLPNASAQSQASEWLTYYENSNEERTAPLAYADTGAIALDSTLWMIVQLCFCKSVRISEQRTTTAC